ncbi:Protein of unknown function [Chryseobacterium arachidis]|uniref:DUF2750 domain-containing protein n=1 Tax=Chryseobacterium arachidis TaxID=1416778 RepID=A0A1M5IA72_9FLAO|nr:DUF2750 domain-containing protein [Chryseobacterium arachidis]SHG24673.1 Protein of unknown function [Chryseobacterium arachidis]
MNSKKFESIMALAPQKRYDYFIKKIADAQQLWTIVDSEGNYAISMIDKHSLISFWPEEEFIASNLEENWEDYKPLLLTLDDLSDNVIDYIAQEGLLINVFPLNGRSGFVVDLEEFSRDLTTELKNYE